MAVEPGGVPVGLVVCVCVCDVCVCVAVFVVVCFFLRRLVSAEPRPLSPLPSPSTVSPVALALGDERPHDAPAQHGAKQLLVLLFVWLFDGAAATC